MVSHVVGVWQGEAVKTGSHCVDQAGLEPTGMPLSPNVGAEAVQVRQMLCLPQIVPEDWGSLGTLG